MATLSPYLQGAKRKGQEMQNKHKVVQDENGLFTIKITKGQKTMNGTITFEDLQALSEFLKEFHGATATFTVIKTGNVYLLTFNGGY